MSKAVKVRILFSSINLPRGTLSGFHLTLGLWVSILLVPATSISNEIPGTTLDNKSQLSIEAETCKPAENLECLVTSNFDTIKQSCPDVSPNIMKNYFPRGQKAAGEYFELGNVTLPDDCAKNCCLNSNCHYAFTINNTCYLLNCIYGSFLCSPQLSSELGKGSEFSMVLLRTPPSKNLSGITCEVGADACKDHQKCIPTNRRSRNGVCVCEEGFSFNEQKQCAMILKTENEVTPRSVISFSSTTASPPVTLTVSVSDKNVTLPETTASLAAYVVPQAPADHSYTYKWTLIHNPADDTATVEGHTTDTLRLTGLKEGKYIFQVTASSLDSNNGSANATVNVFAETKPNLAPLAVISPQEQSIQLPTSSAVLDASLSTDDDKIISYKWELQKGPILYTMNPSKSLNSSTLQVENLIPGNYTFKLIVEDSEHAINSTTANVTVIKETDYPPTANPGKDIVIYLPQTSVILNGNASTDDKKIVDWEWKATGDQQKAIDMQDTHTPYLKLSHLQVGLYQFELKVTDEAGQSTAANVHVVVKEPTGNPPKADAGPDQTTVLNKQNWLILDGSKSKSDSNKITHYNWTQSRGPNNATITSLEDGVRANISGLTKGEYEFLLIVEDETKLSGNSSVKITVIQRVNEHPLANAGGNLMAKLPLTIFQINGSASTDDVKIVNWSWERQSESLAAGIILKDSDSNPILELADLVPGKYVFKLTVKDEQGLTDEDTMTLSVEGEMMEKDLIEVVLVVPLTKFTESDKNQVVQQLDLFLHDSKLILHHILPQLHSGNAVLQLHGEDKGSVINGSSLAIQLRQRLYQDASLLKFPIFSIDTVRCLDVCSGHGTCQDTPDGRECACSAFWMENVIKRKFGNRERNCEWSKIYVGVIVSLLLGIIGLLLWSLSYIFRRNFRALKENNLSPKSLGRNGKRYQSHKKQYTLLDDEELELRAHEEQDAESEDSDSDILFESGERKSKAQNGLLLAPLNGVRNGILKNSRRLKT